VRGALASALVALAAVLLPVAMIAVWADHLFLSPSSWETTSIKLLANPTIRTSTANYLAGQVDPSLEPVISQALDSALGLAPVQALWGEANRGAATALVELVDGPPQPVTIAGDAVSINLGTMLRTAATDAHLPAVVTEALPADADLTIVRSDQVHTVRTAGRVIRDLARWLVIVVPLLWLMALGLARGRRRRTLAWIGTTAVIASVLVLLVRALLVTPVANAISADPSLRRVIAATITTSTTSLVRSAVIVGVVGLVVALIAGLAGLGGSRRRDDLAPTRSFSSRPRPR
jgi:hypothetical protein